MATIILHSPEETAAQGRLLAAALVGGEVLALCGDLGAGKTHLSKGIAEGLDIDPLTVTSPTFTLVHEYAGGRLPLYHFDFYRLESEEEALQLGLDDYLASDGVVLIEWANKFAKLLPAHTKWLTLRSLGPEQRELTD